MSKQEMEKDEHPDSPIVSRKTRQSLEVRTVTQYKTDQMFSSAECYEMDWFDHYISDSSH